VEEYVQGKMFYSSLHLHEQSARLMRLIAISDFDGRLTVA